MEAEADDIRVETVDEEDAIHSAFDQRDGPHNRTPSGISETFYLVLEFVQSYGWIILIVCVALYFLKRKLEETLRHRQSREESALYAKDRDALLQQQLHRDERVRRLQEEQDAAAQRALEKQREKEERLRREKIEDWERYQAGHGYKPKSRHRVEENDTSASATDSSPPHMRPRRSNFRGDDFNPLSGSGGSGGYRPAPRGGFGGSGGG